jgi:AraC-like DNA-binding protein
MVQSHDRASQLLAASSMMQFQSDDAGAERLPILCQESATDPLSDVLRTVKLTGAVFHLVDASFPWGVEVPPAHAYSSIILPHAQHIVSYHIILKGSGWAIMPGVASKRFEAGDILVLANGERYRLLSSPEQEPEYDADATVAFFREWVAGKLPFVTREGGGGAGGTEYLCGFLGCDMQPFNPVLAALPPLIHVERSRRNDLLGRLLDLTLTEARLPRAGGESIRLRLSELIFVEVVRQYLESLPAHETGWLAGLRDPSIGKALALLHERPAHPWTLNGLAREVGMSRAAFAARFAHLVGHSPMEYLTLWRMQVAARLLADGLKKVATIGREVGYGSEAAFSRAFKKKVGASPATWRSRSAEARVPSPREGSREPR